MNKLLTSYNFSLFYKPYAAKICIFTNLYA